MRDKFNGLVNDEWPVPNGTIQFSCYHSSAVSGAIGERRYSDGGNMATWMTAVREAKRGKLITVLLSIDDFLAVHVTTQQVVSNQIA